MVEPSFQGVNRLFVLAFENETQRTSAKSFYLPNVEIKDCNIMINGENFFYQAVKNNKVTYENIRKIATGPGDDYTTGCLLDYLYFKGSYSYTSNQQINVTANVDIAGNTRIYFILEETKETKLDFSQGTVL